MNDSHVINVPPLIRVRVLLTLPRLQSQARTRRNDKDDCHDDDGDDGDDDDANNDNDCYDDDAIDHDCHDDDIDDDHHGTSLTLGDCRLGSIQQAGFFADKDEKLYRAELFVRDAERPFGSSQKLEDKTYIIWGTHTRWVTYIYYMLGDIQRHTQVQGTRPETILHLRKSHSHAGATGI